MTAGQRAANTAKTGNSGEHKNSINRALSSAAAVLLYRLKKICRACVGRKKHEID